MRFCKKMWTVTKEVCHVHFRSISRKNVRKTLFETHYEEYTKNRERIEKSNVLCSLTKPDG